MLYVNSFDLNLEDVPCFPSSRSTLFCRLAINVTLSIMHKHLKKIYVNSSIHSSFKCQYSLMDATICSAAKASD